MKTFRQRVLDIVAAIPKGKVMTYSEVARKAGNARASRAVGMVMSKNYDPSVPCHRVIRKDGGMGGYNRGLKNKIAILKKEGVILKLKS